MNPTDRTRSTDSRVHRALSSQVRNRILDVLRREPDLSAAVIADRVDLHVNTVRTHLGVLEDAGLVRPVTEVRQRPGRPKLLYRASEDAPAAVGAADGQRGYRFLAEVLAGFLAARVPDSAKAAEEAGWAWGRHVVDSPAPFATPESGLVVERLVAMLDEFGFQPVLDEAGADGPRLLLRHCPFLEVAREHQEVVCSVHLGLMRGALDELGSRVRAVDLIPWAEPDVCVSHLQVAPAGNGDSADG